MNNIIKTEFSDRKTVENRINKVKTWFFGR